MSVLAIKNFIDTLRAQKDIPAQDLIFLERIEAQFSSNWSVPNLNTAQLNCLQDVFKERAEAVQGSEYDYLEDEREVSVHWVTFAKSLETLLGKTYIEILYPHVVTETDSKSNDPITQFTGPHELYISADGRTVHKISRLLVKALTSKQPRLQTLTREDGAKEPNSRLLSLSEFLTIRFKPPGEVVLHGETFSSYWNCVQKKILPLWHKSGEIPKQLLPKLLELIEVYFSKDRSLKRLKRVLDEFSLEAKLVASVDIDDLNCLYGQKIGETYLIEILLDCYKGRFEGLDSAMVGLANWINAQDASFIAKTENTLIQNLYKQLKVGAAYTLSELRADLVSMFSKASENTRKAFMLLFKQFKGLTVISPRYIESLQEVFYERFEEEGDFNPNDEKGKVWIRVAQKLQSAGFIKNYYRLLNPNIKNDIDPLLAVPVTYYPLNYYVVGEDGVLILLPNCEKHYKEKEHYRNPNEDPPRKLSEKEIKQIKDRCAKRFHDSIDKANEAQKDDPPILLETVLALREFVRNGFFARALRANETYNASQLEAADHAFDFLRKFKDKLPPEERKNLEAQRGEIDGIPFRLGKLFYYLNPELEEYKQNRPEHCAAGIAYSIAKVVVDYLPTVPFEVGPDEHMKIEQLRVKSSKKTCRDLEKSLARESTRQLKILALSIFESIYQHEMASVSQDLEGIIQDKRFSPARKAILGKILPILKSGDLANAQIVVNVVKQYAGLQLKSKEGARHASFWRAPTAPIEQRWLSSIADETLFIDRKSWFEPRILLKRLQEESLKNSAIRDFLDELIQIYLQSMPLLQKEILINIKLKELFAKLPDDDRDQLLDDLRVLHLLGDDGDSIEFFDMFRNFIIARLIDKALDLKREAQGVSAARLHYRLEGALASLRKDSKHETLSEAVAILKGTITDFKVGVCSESQKQAMLSYLADVTSSLALSYQTAPIAAL